MAKKVTRPTVKRPVKKEVEIEEPEVKKEGTIVELEESSDVDIKKEEIKSTEVAKSTEIATEAIPVSDEIWWRNTGGSFQLGRRKIIKPNEKFKAREADIPIGFRDTIFPLESIPPKVAAPLLMGKKSVYVLKPRGESEEEGFDVVLESTGKKINGKPLDKDTAEKFIADLQK